MERQKQRRLARLSNGGGNGVVDSPRSYHSSATSGGSTRSDEQQHLLGKKPELPRRRAVDEGHDLLLTENQRHDVNLMSV